MNYHFKKHFPIELREKARYFIKAGSNLLIFIGIIFIILIISKISN